MDANWMITAFVMIDTLMETLEHTSDVRAQVPDSEIVLIAVVAAKYFGNHHERAVQVLTGCRSLSGTISVSRFNRRLHALADWVELLARTLGEVFAHGAVFVIDSLPMPVCRRVRARRCRKVRGRAYCGYCAAKKEKFFGWRLHLICTPNGIPVSFQVAPAGFHDLTPIHELAYDLPTEARVFGDKGYNAADEEARMLADTGVRLIPVRKANMQPHAWFVDEIELREYRHTIETVNSQLEKMGIERLYTRTNTGFDLKVHASLIALTCTNMN
ncbi:MAG: IS982 family transposase [Chloroflexales bacterium]|nr:IS982 family transposase [Chloroflexales bacterium]